MKICALPVSGGEFPTQIGLLSALSSHSGKPDILMGSSGGNIASYISLAGNFHLKGMKEIISSLGPDTYSQSWVPNSISYFLPSWVVGYFKGSIYAEGKGFEKIFNKFFDQKNITEVEIWTGTVNRTKEKAEFFCNRALNKSLIKGSEFPYRNIGCLPLQYLDGKVDQIAKVTLASASIPIVVPEQKIGKDSYADGGIMFASPLSVLKEQIYSPSLHINYISSYDVEKNYKPAHYRSILDNTNVTLREFVKGNIYQDRLSGLDLLRYRTNKTVYFKTFDSEDLSKVEKYRLNYDRTFVELFPQQEETIDIFNFKPKDVMKQAKRAYRNFKGRFWWIE